MWYLYLTLEFLRRCWPQHFCDALGQGLMLLILIGGVTPSGSVSAVLTCSNLSEEGIGCEVNVWIGMESVELG